MWKYLLAGGLFGVASGLTIYSVRTFRAPADDAPPLIALHSESTQPQGSGSDPNPKVSVDPSLILPEKLPDAEGVFLDPALQTVRSHYKELARPIVDGPSLDGPALPPLPTSGEPRKLPEEVSGPELPPAISEVKVRIPNLPGTEEPPIAPVVGQVDPKASGVKRIGLEVPIHNTGDNPLPPSFTDPTPSSLPGDMLTPIPREEPMPEPKPIATPTLTNSREVMIDFEVGRKGASGIKRTELWVREAGQKEWKLLDQMRGSTTPFSTCLPGEGTYELQAVVVSGSGRRSVLDAGKAVFVEVDMTPPTVEFRGISPVNNETTDAVRITWRAEDRKLAAKPINLEYSWDGLEWIPIIEDLENTGEYIWRVPGGKKHEVQLRIVARDAAGNDGIAYLPPRVSVDLVIPDVRIQTVRPRKISDGVERASIGSSVEGILRAQPERLPMPREMTMPFPVPSGGIFDTKD